MSAMTAWCPHCEKLVRVGIPRGGDGSANVYYRHRDAAGQPCPYSRLIVEDDGDTDQPPDDSADWLARRSSDRARSGRRYEVTTIEGRVLAMAVESGGESCLEYDVYRDGDEDQPEWERQALLYAALVPLVGKRVRVRIEVLDESGSAAHCPRPVHGGSTVD